MSKYKFDIKTKDLSWEKNYPRICDKEECNENGKYKAPKSRSNLKNYYFFCLDHVKLYNKSWNFYKKTNPEISEERFDFKYDRIWSSR